MGKKLLMVALFVTASQFVVAQQTSGEAAVSSLGAEYPTKEMLRKSYGIFQTCRDELWAELRSENAPRAKFDFVSQIRIQLAFAPSMMVDGSEIDANDLIFNREPIVLVYTDPNTTESEWSKNLLAQCKMNLFARLKRASAFSN